MSEELKPCPFCGGEANLYKYAKNGKFLVRCEYCGVETIYFGTEEIAIKAWNRRVNDEIIGDDYKCPVCGFEYRIL